MPEGTQLGKLIDDPELAPWAPVGNAVVCSIALGVSDLLAMGQPPLRAWPPARALPARAEPPAPDALMSAAYVLQALAALRSHYSIVVEEAPSARPVMFERLPILQPETFHEMCSGGLGFGLAAAVGVALAEPARRVIALIGDGSATARRCSASRRGGTRRRPSCRSAC